MICPNCKSEIPDTVKVCGNCGHKITVSASQTTPQPAIQPQARTGMPKWVWGILGVAGLFGIIGVVIVIVWFTGSTQTPSPQLESPTVSGGILPTRTFLPTLPQKEEPTNTPTMPPPTNTPKPKEPPVLGTAAEAKPLFMGLKRPRLMDIKNEGFDFYEELKTGKSDFKHTVDVKSSDEVLWTFGTCQQTRTKREDANNNIQISFYVNEKLIDIDKHFSINEYQAADGLWCRVYAALIKEWPAGQHLVETRLSISTDIPVDFGDTYPAGNKSIEFLVSVEP